MNLKEIRAIKDPIHRQREMQKYKMKQSSNYEKRKKAKRIQQLDVINNFRVLKGLKPYKKLPKPKQYKKPKL